MIDLLLTSKFDNSSSVVGFHGGGVRESGVVSSLVESSRKGEVYHMKR